MRPPLIVDEHGDLVLFKDSSSLEGYLEAIDVQNHEYIVYDSEGRRIELSTPTVPTRSLLGLLKGTAEVVRVHSWEPEPTHAAELVSKLHAMLARLGDQVQPQASLAELLQRLRERAGFVA